VTRIVVEVGPTAVRGPNPADAQWVSAGIDDIDDELTLIDDRPVCVADVWRTIMHHVIGGAAEAIVLVCPTWWAASRVDRIRDAATAVANDVVVLRRAQALAERLETVIEIAPEFVVVSPPEGNMQVVSRGDTEAIMARISTSTPVVVDSPEGVDGACAMVIVDRLRANGVAVTIADFDRVRRSVEVPPSRDQAPGHVTSPLTNVGRRGAAVLAGTLLAAAVLCVGFAVRQDRSTESMPMTLLVERRVGVMVPAQWAVERITSGPGSVRVQVVSPNDADVAVHITQSLLATDESLEQVAESLRNALSEQPDGVFVGFNPSDHRAGKPVASYREVRPDHHIAWVVLTDKSLRIAIGCQSAPGHEDAVRAACDEAIRSAHAVF
jgi:type VII secretion-associated protein (TIGR03931 family)